MIDESVQTLIAMLPYEEDVINKSQPEQWLFWVSIDMFVLEVRHEYVGIGGGDSRAHSCACGL